MELAPMNRWIEVDLDAVVHNCQEVLRKLGDRTRLIAVVKADAYGHGAGVTALVLQQQGVDFFAVTYLDEALELRKNGITGSILVFAPVVTEEEVREAIRGQLTLTVNSLFDAELYEKVSFGMNMDLAVHIKVDTGLGRFGVQPDQVKEVIKFLANNERIYIEGIYTHFAEAMSASPKYTEKQFTLFQEVLESLQEEKIRIPIRHCANSAAFLKYPHMHMDAVRIGTLISGQYPPGKYDRELSLEDPFTLKSRVIALHNMPAGAYLGYNRSYKLKQAAMVAVIPVGYHDGFNVGVANKGAGIGDVVKKMAKQLLTYFDVSRFRTSVTIKGKAYPVRAKVFMQMALVEIPLVSNINVGDEVELPARKTLVSPGIKRLFVTGGDAVKISDLDRTRYIVSES